MYGAVGCVTQFAYDQLFRALQSVRLSPHSNSLSRWIRMTFFYFCRFVCRIRCGKLCSNEGWVTYKGNLDLRSLHHHKTTNNHHKFKQKQSLVYSPTANWSRKAKKTWKLTSMDLQSFFFQIFSISFVPMNLQHLFMRLITITISRTFLLIFRSIYAGSRARVSGEKKFFFRLFLKITQKQNS